MAYLLIVDDDEDFAAAVAVVLRARGHEVALEARPGHAVQRVAQRRPDLLILDVMFPEDNAGGYRLARTLRSADPGLRILLLTAVSTAPPPDLMAPLTAGSSVRAPQVLAKPIDLEELATRVGAML